MMPCHFFPVITDRAIQTFAKVRIGDFLGVRRADRRDAVGVDHAHSEFTQPSHSRLPLFEEFLRQADDVAHDRRRIHAWYFEL